MEYKFLLLSLYMIVPKEEALITSVEINTNEVIEAITDQFIGVTIDTSIIQANWETLNLRSTKVQTLAKNLSPSYLRVGGTTADYCLFNSSNCRKNSIPDHLSEKFKRNTGPDLNIFNGNFNPMPLSYNINRNFTNFTMTVEQWDELNQFAELVGWDLIFDLNSLLRENGQWFIWNAKQLMDYTSHKGYKIAGWELGNEPDIWQYYGHQINGSVHAYDYKQLHSLLSQYPQWRNSLVIGPSCTMLDNLKTYDYTKEFLDTGGPNIVTNPTFHHYYGPGSTMTMEKFMDPKILDSLSSQINIAKKIGPHPPYGKFWLGETSSAYNGGAFGLSDRYVAGFMWLDKLGMSAAMGLGAVIRQDFYGGNYGLIDTKTLDPNPDYWLTYLYKVLVGGPVLNVTVEDESGYVRMYAHCTNSKLTKYKPGSVTVYGMNLKEEPATVLFPLFTEDIELHLYLLEPVGRDSLKSQMVALNGKTLQLGPDMKIPNILTPEVVLNSVTLPQQSFGFIVIPEANAAACQIRK